MGSGRLKGDRRFLLAKTYSMSRLTYPSGFEHLPDVRSAILEAFLPAPVASSR